MTYDLDGSPASGPSSFAVLDDGSVVVADTMAVERGEPRLLRYDRLGELRATIDLAGEEVAAIVDVVTDGSNLAILDIFVARDRYRVLTMNRDGEVTSTVEIPPGFRFEDGLTGLVWDDDGILLEFQLGLRHARIAPSGAIESPAVPVFDGVSIELIPLSDQTTEVVTGSSSFNIERTSEFDGVSLVGLSPQGSIVVVLDEVDMSGPVIAVTRRVQRYSANGQLKSEQAIDAGDRFLEILRPFELDAAGNVLYLQALPDRVALVVIEP